MTQLTTIALDVMGGDLGPRSAIAAAVQWLNLQPKRSCQLILVGDRALIQNQLKTFPDCSSQFDIVHAPDVITMADKPTWALRAKPKASMRQAIDLVASGQAEACVSAGNTGALMVIGRYVLKTLPGIDRPAIVSRLPTQQGVSYLLDLGANVDCHSEHLYQFAVLAALLVECLHGISSPTVGLLNVGSEAIKGNEQVRLARQLIESNSKLNFTGYVEGNQLFQGHTSVVVCDGFVGNVALKTSEGLAEFILASIQEMAGSWLRNPLTRWLTKRIFHKLHQQIDPRIYNGASLLGLQGTVIKSHGHADSLGFSWAIEQAYQQAQLKLPQVLNEALEAWLEVD
ncbi:phosphate acyltransferase PlsX [Spartinivicinus ruber]|uniref:phosphate acyltransferase PlsX n=1 Tax=Spartinivicinus ruber TaxID=2683272 RepID=UPI0013D27084|nr:phosphate acyltransferase PlsX [Spartinivicinus ruber]